MLLAPVRLIELMSACTSGVMTSAFGPGETVGWVEAPFAGAVVPGDGAGAALVGGDGGAVVGMGRPDRWVVVVVAKVGGGWGELAARIPDGTGARVVSTDLSPRMAGLARGRELPVALADVQSLPFRDSAFDAVVANAMLYHVPDLDRGLAEIVRVLAPAGRLVATTFAHDHLAEVWDLVDGPGVGLSFNAENGATVLGTHFGSVEVRPGGGTVTFPNADELRTYVASTITRSYLADRVPDLAGPFVAHSSFAVFVASDPR